MIDFLKLSVPFKPEYVLSSDDSSFVDLKQIGELAQIKLSARNVEFEVDGDLSVSGLSHPWESIPSWFSGLALKIHGGGQKLPPCVELKASPAKLLQGHNVYGSDDLELCAFEMLFVLAESHPYLYDLLSVNDTTLDWIDVTFSARADNQSTALQVIHALRNVRNGHIKPSRYNEAHETTVYWNKGSRHIERKAYLKLPELLKDFGDLNKKIEKAKTATYVKEENYHVHRRYFHLSSIFLKLQQYAVGLIRFEARLKRRWLDEFKLDKNNPLSGFPLNLFEAINFQKSYELTKKSCLIADMWRMAFKELFAAIEGESMNIYDDEKVKVKLNDLYASVTRTGNISYAKADRVFRFYRALVAEGYDAVRDSYSSRMSFWRLEQDLLLAGFSKVQLQQLYGSKDSNVIPLIRIVNVDFGKQHPDFYQEPVSRFVVAA